jgi:hypothetical protein
MLFHTLLPVCRAGTGVRPPFLQHLSRLTSLTTLDLGGCQASEAELIPSLPHFNRLQHLTLWGCSAGDAVVPHLAQLPNLQQLDMAWSLLRAAVPAVTCSSLQQLDLSHCRLEGSWEEVATAAVLAVSSCSGDGAAAGGLGDGVRLRELRMVQAAVSAGVQGVLESILRWVLHTRVLLKFHKRFVVVQMLSAHPASALLLQHRLPGSPAAVTLTLQATLVLHCLLAYVHVCCSWCTMP